VLREVLRKERDREDQEYGTRMVDEIIISKKGVVKMSKC
jgi:hypothetical protein